VEGTTGRRREKGRGSSADRVRPFSSSTSRPAAVQFGESPHPHYESSQVNTKSKSKTNTNRRVNIVVVSCAAFGGRVIIFRFPFSSSRPTRCCGFADRRQPVYGGRVRLRCDTVLERYGIGPLANNNI